MAARSIVNQNLLLQAESVPGTPLTAAMKRYLSLRGTIGWDIQKEYFRASGSKVDTAENILAELGTVQLEAMQDYNAMLPLLTGIFGKPTTTTVEAGKVFSHKFELKAFAADALQTFTAVWGDTTQALRASYMAFHGMTLGIQRQQLNLSVNGILRAPESFAYPSSGISSVPMVPMRSSTYCAYLDDAWGDLGDTKLLNLYSTELSFGDKYTPDWIVDCALPSFSELIENENVEYRQSMTLGFDASAKTQIDDALNGEMKFVRLEATGPEIPGAANSDAYKLTIDTAVRLNPQRIGSSPSSPATVVEFDGRLMVDPATDKVAEVTLVNGLASV